MLKKLILYWKYKKAIKRNLSIINNHFLKNPFKNFNIQKIELDKACRLYTVLNFNPSNDMIMSKTYNYRFIDDNVKTFVSDLDFLLKQLKVSNKINVSDIVSLTKSDLIDKTNVLIMIEFKIFDTLKYFYIRLILKYLLFFSIIGTLFFIFF
jgi:hypothetical protein